MKVPGGTAMSETAKIPGVVDLTFYEISGGTAGIWIRCSLQVGQNSVYMFQLILGTYLLKTANIQKSKNLQLAWVIFLLGTMKF